MTSDQTPQRHPDYIEALLRELPHSVILPSDAAAFKDVVESNWSKQNREIIPACIVRPRDAQQLSRAVGILKREHASRGQQSAAAPGFFAVRSGGTNTGLGFATVQGGAVIDLGQLNEISPAVDGLTVTVGAGVKWGELYAALDAKGLTVVGGRNSPVGVGGLTLQGGLSFYSPKHGLVCSNVVRYEIVLADGSVVNASATENADLWRALKGGSSNFGIVTRFTMRSFTSTPIWVGQTYVPAVLQRDRAFKALHGYLNHASSGQPGSFDENAAGPILSFAHVSGLPFHIMALHLAYTAAPEDGKWPVHWKDSGFASLWRFWSTSDIQSHGSAAAQLAGTTPAGTRHVHGTTTIRNDIETIRAAYDIFCEATAKLHKVKGLMFPLIFQAILPAWMNKGDPNIFGLDKCTEPLIILNCSVAWESEDDDDLVRTTVANLWKEVDATAAARKADHPYKFINYCMDFQRPFDGCGEENRRLLREASLKYDPDGLFQSGLAGGHKLDGLL